MSVPFSSTQGMQLPFRAILSCKAGSCTSLKRTPARREKARTLAERALQLEPDLPEAHMALGVLVLLRADKNYDAALREFQIAQRGLPNEAEVYLGIGAIQRRQGIWAESTANFEEGRRSKS